MALLDDLANALALDTVKAMEELGDDRLFEEISKVLGAASPTVQEAYMTSIRFLLAEKRGRKALEALLEKARAEKGRPGSAA
ncbi:MAG: hypothetical protein R3D84_14165 [Paracoccaceae bacterium]